MAETTRKDPFEIKSVSKSEKGHWIAEIEFRNRTYVASREFGSWMLVEDGHMRGLNSVVAAEIQKIVRGREDGGPAQARTR